MPSLLVFAITDDGDADLRERGRSDGGEFIASVQHVDTLGEG